jgi:hypothetical protein
LWPPRPRLNATPDKPVVVMKPGPRPVKDFYTVDDGATLFADKMETLPPFDHEGKPAVRAGVYSYDGGKTHFVAWLQKLPEDALKERIANAGGDPAKVDDDDVAALAGWLVKKPGDAQWVNSKTDYAKYAAVKKAPLLDGKIKAQRLYAEYK